MQLIDTIDTIGPLRMYLKKFNYTHGYPKKTNSRRSVLNTKYTPDNESKCEMAREKKSITLTVNNYIEKIYA